MATSISPVATIWLSAPSNSHGQNAGVGQGTLSPVAASTAAKNAIENGNPNRKRMLVAPQVPRGPVNCRCMALRATCPSAAVIVNGIQSEAMLNICGRDSDGARQPPCRARPIASTIRIACTNREVVAANARCSDPLRHHHVVHVHVGGQTPAVGERAIDDSGLFDDGELVVLQMTRE